MEPVDERAKIKFCGITRQEDAEFAVELEAWAIGMIFWEGSPRAVDPAVAMRISRSLRRSTEIAGVFFNQPIDYVTEMADVTGLSLIQLHGDEGAAFCAEVARRTGARVIKSARIAHASDVQAIAAFRTAFHLLDTYRDGVPGGTGETFDWALVTERVSELPVLLSGGLTPDNVAAGMEQVKPFGVDVASGVESVPGVKDHDLMRAFAEAAHAAQARISAAAALAAADEPGADASEQEAQTL